MKTLAILQARVSSKRLPGKVLKPLCGQPMVVRQSERIRRSRLVDGLVVATSADTSDDALEAVCREASLDVFRGSLNDVLDRFCQAARKYRPHEIVRLTGDCPLTDPGVIDDVVMLRRRGGYDYASNALEPSYPDGLDVEAMTFEALEEAWRRAALPSEREHVTPYLYRQGSEFSVGRLTSTTDLSELRWTVDEPADYRLVEIIYDALYPANPRFCTADVLALLERRPELKTMNKHHRRNEGYSKSLAADPKAVG